MQYIRPTVKWWLWYAHGMVRSALQWEQQVSEATSNIWVCCTERHGSLYFAYCMFYAENAVLRCKVHVDGVSQAVVGNLKFVWEGNTFAVATRGDDFDQILKIWGLIWRKQIHIYCLNYYYVLLYIILLYPDTQHEHRVSRRQVM